MQTNSMQNNYYWHTHAKKPHDNDFSAEKFRLFFLAIRQFVQIIPVIQAYDA